MEISRRHRLRLPRDLALLLKTFVMEEGLALQLDPDFRLAVELKPYAYRHLAVELSPAELASRLKRFSMDIAELGIDLPRQLHRTLDVLATGGFEIHLRTDEVEDVINRAERLTNRLAVSVLAAALIDALAELAAADRTRIPAKRTLVLPLALAAAVAVMAGGRGRRRPRRVSHGIVEPR
jgi:ubiquinone biosynthesis protein